MKLGTNVWLTETIWKKHESPILTQDQGHTIQTFEAFLSYLVTLIVALGIVENLNIYNFPSVNSALKLSLRQN